MKHSRAALIAGTALVTALALTSCASNEGTPSGGSSGSASSGSGALSGTLNGVGSSAQSNAQTAWTKGFQTTNPDVTINYDPQGSGAGRTAFMSGGSNFAGSDSALKDEELSGTFAACDGKGIDIPVYVSPIALVYNLDGVDTLNMDATTLAKIFSGKITKWNDAAITKLNPDASLPNENITPVYRSDSSGTTTNFTDYLHTAAASDWPNDPADAFPYKTGEGAAKGSGVVAAVTAGKGSIGYVDNSSAGTLSTAGIAVGSDYVKPSAEVASAAAEAATVDTTREANDTVVTIDRQPTDATQYPITLVSYLIACQTYKDSSVGSLVSAYAKYITSSEGQSAAADSAKSAPLTGKILTDAEAAAATIK